MQAAVDRMRAAPGERRAALVPIVIDGHREEPADRFERHTPVFNKDGKKIAEFSAWHGPGSVIKRKATDFHWLELDQSVGPATTLFFMGSQQRDWGFLVDKYNSKTRWIQWEYYLNNYKEYHSKYIEPKMVSMMSRKKD
jgi:hypothetical protein